MRLILTFCILGALSALLALPAHAARNDTGGYSGNGGYYGNSYYPGSGVDLNNYDVVISDMGDRFPGWDQRPDRVYVAVLDGRYTRDEYFDNPASALFVLREQYGAPRIDQFDVLDYTGLGWIDGRQAFYLWSYDEYDRGGVPLVLAFANYNDAMAELYYRHGEVLNFHGLVATLYKWADDNRDVIYWRGWDNTTWTSDNWDRAWNDRWNGWGRDSHHGWLQFNINIGSNHHRGQDNGQGYGNGQDNGQGYYNNGQGDHNGQGNGNGQGYYNNGQDNGKGSGKDNGNGKGSGKDNGNGKGSGKDNGNGKGSGKDNGNGKGSGKDNGSGKGSGSGSGNDQNYYKGKGSGSGKGNVTYVPTGTKGTGNGQGNGNGNSNGNHNHK
jgi:hypothetical protein